MKKILTIIAILLPLIYLTSCQEDPVQPDNTPLIEFVSKTDTVTAVSGLLESRVEIKNITSKQVSIKVKVDIVSLTPGHKSLICLGSLCYGGVTEDKLYPGEIILSPQQTSTKTDFFAELSTLGIPGTSVIRYNFIPNGDTTKTISYTTTYRVTTGL